MAEETETYDAIVVGLGGMGSATAWQLARRGVRVLGLEQFTPAHDLGSSHGDTRIVRMAYFEAPDYVPLLRRSYELWDELGQQIGTELFIRTGALMIGAADADVVAGTLASAVRWQLPHERLDRDEMARRYPQFALEPGQEAVFESNAGYVDPQAAVRAHLQLAERDGADLRFETPVLGWAQDDDGVTVRTDAAEFRAHRLIITAGAWAERLAPGLDVPLRVGRRVMHYLHPLAAPEDFATDRFPVFVYQIAPGDAIYGFPWVDDPDAGVKIGFHYRGDDVDADEIDRMVSAEEEEELRGVLAERIPALAGPHVRSVVCMYTLTPDEHFVIDRLPGTAGRVVVAAGFSGHGFKFTPVVGEILADLALLGRSGLPIGFLSAGRFRG